MERKIKDFGIANNLSLIESIQQLDRTGVPRWHFDMLRTGDPSLALLIEIVPRNHIIMPLLCVCTSRPSGPRRYSDLLSVGGSLSRALRIEIVPRNHI